MEQQIKVPKLRFPEFDGNWIVEDGEDVFEGVSNKKHNSDLPILAITQEFGAIPRDLIEFNVSVTDKSIETYKVVDVGDFIISLRSFQGGIEYSNFQGICSPAYIILKPKVDIERSFFRIYFKTDKYIKLLTQKLEGIRDGKMISFKYFSDAKLVFTTILEQTKISTFLTAIEDRLSQLKKKKSLLEQYKKGVMHQVFSQELRFKDENGTNFADWEEVILMEISINISSGKSKQCSDFGEFPFYGSTGVIGFSNRYDYSGENILIARVGANAGTLYMVSGCYSVSDNTLMLTLKKSANTKFIYFFLGYINLNKLVFGSGQPLITGGQLKGIKISLPTLPEQTKIANFLSTIDDKIAQTSLQIEKMQFWKKGLLQQMFC